MRAASFFSGIGGIDLGFERAGVEIVFQSEINPFGRQILKQHWPNAELAGDINLINPEDIPKADIYFGGFPCQDLSLANQGKRKGLAGERSGLFFKFAELAGAARPRWILLENVPGLLNSNHGEDFRTLIAKMDELGYGVSWRVLDAKYFGTPQRRRRVYVVGSLGTLRSAEVLLEESLRQAHKQKGTEMMEKPTPATHEEAPMLYVRRMLPLEYERLQGFPDNWTLPDGQL